MSPHPLPPAQTVRSHLRMEVHYGGHGLDNGVLVIWSGALDQLHEEDHEHPASPITHGKASA